MQLSPRGRKIYFLIVVLVFGGAILAVSAINGRGPLGEKSYHSDLPFGARTATYFSKRSFKPPQSLFSDELSYYIAPPAVGGIAADKKFPLILLLHDDTGYAAAADYLLSPSLRQLYPAFVVVPVIGRGDAWAQAGEIKLRFGAETQKRADDALHLVQDIVQSAPIDTNRIYVLGCGQGGTGVFRAVQNFPDVVTAGVAISGRWHVNKVQDIQAVPLWILQGQYDQATPARYMYQLVTQVQKLNSATRFTSVPGMGVDCRDTRLYMNALWGWLLTQEKQSALPEVPSDDAAEDVIPRSP